MQWKPLLIGLVAGLLLGEPAVALAQDVNIEGSQPGDGFARAGKCVVSPRSIFVPAGTDDTQGMVHIKCGQAGSSRIVLVHQVEVMPDGTRRRFETTQFDFGGNKTPNKDFFTDLNTSCGPGEGRYSLDVEVWKVGNESSKDVELWTTTITLDVDGCL
jgi:hypothetical protein